MSRIETKLSPRLGGEFGLQGAASGLPAPVRGANSADPTAQPVQLVGADNAVKGVLSETARSSARDGRQFVFSPANSRQESLLPARVSTFDEAKAFVRKHIAEGQWQDLRQAGGARLGTLGESQLFGSNSRAKATPGSLADTSWKKAETKLATFDATAAASAQTPPTMLRSAAEAQRHVTLERDKAAQQSQHQPESTATNPETKTGGVASVQAEPVPAPEPAKVQPHAVLNATKLRETAHDQMRSGDVKTVFLNSRGEVIPEPSASATRAAEASEKRNSLPAGASVIAFAAANLFVLLALGLYLLGPRPTSTAPSETSLSGGPAALSAAPSLTSVSVARPDTSPQTAPFEAQRDVSSRSGGKRDPKAKTENKCTAAAATGESDSTCPSGGQQQTAR